MMLRRLIPYRQKNFFRLKIPDLEIKHKIFCSFFFIRYFA